MFFAPIVSLALIALIAAPTRSAAQSTLDPQLISDKGEAPELTNTAWINADKPLRLADLRGKVVLLDFWTFNCSNCQHTLPYLKDAYAKYKSQGVEFIGVHYPETSFESDFTNVQAAVKNLQITYPVTTDNDGATWNAYEMHAWPAITIIDKNGHKRYRQIGEGLYDTITQVLDALVAEPGPAPATGAFHMSDNPLVAKNYGPAPELHNTDWINTDSPVHIADQRGKVVLLEFWTFDCINCKHTLPAMNDYYAKYHDKGLVIIGDHFPELSFEHDIDNVRAAVKADGIKYAIAIDNDGKTWNAYNQLYWPTMILIDKQGNMRYKVFGEHDYSITDAAIQALLSE